MTRCGGISGFLRVAALCDARGIDLSAHCASRRASTPAPPSGTCGHLEYFHDRIRVERLLFDGALEPAADGTLAPDPAQAGTGLAVRRSAAEPRVR